MNHKTVKRLELSYRSQQGYTLVEAILAIAVCGFGLAMILGLYGMAVKTELVSKNIFEQSVEINSLSDEIGIALISDSRLDLNEITTMVLSEKYPDYELRSVQPMSQSNLYRLEILHKGVNGSNKVFFIKLFWKKNGE
jgi:type II secretory pathway pseudopilin PulG